MKQTHYLTTTIQAGNRLEVELPHLPVGQPVEIILIVPESSGKIPPQIDRRTFLKLPIADRQKILEQQAEAAFSDYQQNLEWQEWDNFDTMDHDYEA